MTQKSKIIIILSAIITILFILTISVFYFTANRANTRTYDEIVKKLITENYFKEDELGDCKQFTRDSDCLVLFNAYIIEGTDYQLKFIGIDTFNQNGETTSKLDQLAHDLNYRGLQDEYGSIISQKNSVVSKYIKDNRSDFEKIAKLLDKDIEQIKIKNIYIKGGWAIVSAAMTGTDESNIILKKEAAWQVLAGPGTDFDQSELISKGLLADMTKRLNIVYSTTLLNYGIPEIKDRPYLGGNIKEPSGTTPIAVPESLPIANDQYQIRIEYKNNKPCYNIVVYYYGDEQKEKNKNSALSWLKDNGVDTNKSCVNIEYLGVQTE